MKKNLFIIILICMGCVFKICGQDTINMLNGKQIIAKTIYNEENKTFLRYDIDKGKSVKLKMVDMLDVYSLSFHNKPFRMVYAQDSSLGFYLSVDEMGMFIKGERMALNHYKAPWVAVGGFALGFAPTMAWVNFYGLAIPPVYGLGVGLITPKPKVPAGGDQMLLNDQNFREGYKTAATRKLVKSALIGSIAGVFAAGITGLTIYYLKN